MEDVVERLSKVFCGFYFREHPPPCSLCDHGTRYCLAFFRIAFSISVENANDFVNLRVIKLSSSSPSPPAMILSFQNVRNF